MIWSERAIKSLKDDHIKKDSVPAAKIVKSEIINASKGLNAYPDKYQLDDITLIIQGILEDFFDGAIGSFIKSTKRLLIF